MEITGIKAGHLAAGKTSSKKNGKLTDSLRGKIMEYAREDAVQNVASPGFGMAKINWIK